MGLAPAAHGGNRTGRIFTGDRSGDWLFAALHRAGLATCRPASPRGTASELRAAGSRSGCAAPRPATRRPPSERGTCSGWLAAELRRVLPTTAAVVVLGGFGWRALPPALRAAGQELPARLPAFGHGVEVALPGGPVLLGCYHLEPAEHLHRTAHRAMLDAVLHRARVLAALDRAADDLWHSFRRE